MKSILQIKGTHCHSCKALIEEVCLETPGITSCEVDFATGKTVVEHQANVDWEKLKREVAALGDYRVESIQPLND